MIDGGVEVGYLSHVLVTILGLYRILIIERGSFMFLHR